MTIHLAAMRMVLRIDGARSLKDRRKAVRSLQDRVTHRFDVTWNEVERSEEATRCVVFLTTGGEDSRLLQSIFDRIRHFVDMSGKAWAEHVDVDISPWHPHDQLDWMIGEDHG